jgi:predicted transcriptional regulator
MYNLPQELEVWYVIPAIRRELSKCLIKNHGMSYEKVGNYLGITKAAVSQYVKNKRASKIKLHDHALKEVCKSCDLIVENKRKATAEIMRILKFIREEDLSCEVCDKNIKGALEGCKEFKVSYDI